MSTASDVPGVDGMPKIEEQAETIPEARDDSREARKPALSKDEDLMDEDDPYLAAARQHGCLLGVWSLCRVTKPSDTWKALPSEYFTRKPLAPSHRSKLQQATADDKEHTKVPKILPFAIFTAPNKINPDVRSVGLGGDVWVTEETVQVFDGSVWRDWQVDQEIRHPHLEDVCLAWQPGQHRLAYGGAGRVAWGVSWRDDESVVEVGFRLRMADIYVEPALQRLRTLAPRVNNTRPLSQEALAAMIFPVYDPVRAVDKPKAKSRRVSRGIKREPTAFAGLYRIDPSPVPEEHAQPSEAEVTDNQPAISFTDAGLTDREATETDTPLRKGELRWGNNEVTSTPVYSHPPEDGTEQHPDGRMMGDMAKAKLGVLPLPDDRVANNFRPPGSPIVVMRLTGDDGNDLSDVEIGQTIVRHLQDQRFVLIKECKTPRMAWEEDDMASLCGGQSTKGSSANVRVEWQSAKKRSESRERGNEGDLYESGTLSELARLIKANVSGDWPLNLLSLPSSEERAPSFIRIIRDNVRAAGLLHWLPADTYSVKTRESLSWALVSGAGAYSYPHVDASGLATFIIVTHGCKFWAILHMKPTASASEVSTARELAAVAFKQYLKIAEYSNWYDKAPVELPGLATVHFIKLEPGMIAIQPPGLFHQVYTPVDTITVGGHFLSESTLHLTLACRMAIHQATGAGTNNYQEDTCREIARLLLAAVSNCDPTMNKRGFIAVWQMLSQRNLFGLADVVKQDEHDDDMCYFDTEFEIDLAIEVARLVFKHNNLDCDAYRLDEKNPTPFFGDDLPWYECGDATVELPTDLGDMMRERVAGFNGEKKAEIARRDMVRRNELRELKRSEEEAEKAEELKRLEAQEVGPGSKTKGGKGGARKAGGARGKGAQAKVAKAGGGQGSGAKADGAKTTGRKRKLGDDEATESSSAPKRTAAEPTRRQPSRGKPNKPL